MGPQPGGQRAAQLVRVDGPAGEDLRAGDHHGHDVLLAVTGVTAWRMVRLPSVSTVAVVPPGTTTVVVGTSTIAGPVSRCPARSRPQSQTGVSAKPSAASRQTGRRPACAAAGSGEEAAGISGRAGENGSTPVPRTRKVMAWMPASRKPVSAPYRAA